MPIRVECPECGKSLNVRDELRGKKIACPKCEEVIKVPAGKKSRADDDDDEAIQERPRARIAAGKPPARRSRDDYDDDDFDDAPPSRRRGQKEKKSRLGLILGLGAGGVGLAAGIVVLILVLNNKSDTKEGQPDPIVKGPDQKEKIEQKPDGKPDPKVNPKPDPDAGKQLPAQMDLEVVQRVKQATVYLRVTSPSGQVAEGSGFFAVEPGIVITNAHVLGMLQATSRPPKQVDVVVHSGEEKETKLVGEVLGVDRASDLAVVKVQGNLPAPLPLELDRKLVETQKVYIFGFPFGAQLGKNITVSESSISSLRKEQIQVNGGMHPGNSGGPVVNALGRVIGVSVAGIPGTQINFAVPAQFVKLNLEGRFLEYKPAEAFLKSGTAYAPVHFKCLDALGRIREARLEVWTGVPGPSRPFSLVKPAPVARDGEREAHSLTYQNGIATGEVPLPKVLPGQVVWVQPVIVSATGTTQWGTAHAIDSALALERKPADLTAKTTALKERGVHLKSSQSVTIIKGKNKALDADHAELDLVEAISPDPVGAKVRVGFAKPQLSFEEDGRQGKVLPNVVDLLSRIPPAFTVDNTNKLRGRTDINLNPKLNFQIRAQVGDYYNQICNAYEAVNLIMPNRTLQAQEAWPTMLPMLLKTGKKSEVVDLVLTCTYEGTRSRDNRPEALVSVVGRVQGRNKMKKLVDGNVAGKFAFDLTGYIAKADLAITTEASLFGDLQVISVFDIKLVRMPGNPLNIALPVRTDPGPIKKGDTPVANPEKFTKPAAGPKPASSFRLVSSPGEFIGQGKAYAFPPQAMIIKKTDRGVQVSVAGFNVQIGAPRGQFLEKKEYQGAKRYAFSDTAPGLDVTGPGRGAGNVFGAFVVWELEMQGNNITRLAIDFVQRSERPTNPPLTGKIRWNSRLQ